MWMLVADSPSCLTGSGFVVCKTRLRIPKDDFEFRLNTSTAYRVLSVLQDLQDKGMT
ncbi:uncharacterized protein PHALS_05548 [Plasmopara halstedii]|uniref:Uncharacterized protein n=1 Tax=Plasmopara halstedii TaxID=4781 RepID=A0A0P1B2P5_PLAHL|nr:uncharacterized protein PHALS_05548 [Plasmopara halstedii]CEG48072.1 hypothetical protein PHALS_05548 [Plasmopara halstedii]|eukprot:XP_024584441.1 hypothetical protein PHALS_05548 [Plasmopara halstedii]